MTKISFTLKIKERDLALLHVEQLRSMEEVIRGYAHLVNVPAGDPLSGKYIITIEVEGDGDLWDAANQYRDLIHELECIAGYSSLEYPERPDVVETNKPV